MLISWMGEHERWTMNMNGKQGYVNMKEYFQ
jgi:hypothetical protein